MFRCCLFRGDRVGRSFTPPSFEPVQNLRPVTKWSAEINDPARTIELMRRAFHLLRNGKPGPVLLELPSNIGGSDLPGEFSYAPPKAWRAAPDPADMKEAAAIVLKSKDPVIHAGQGVLYAGATEELVQIRRTDQGAGAYDQYGQEAPSRKTIRCRSALRSCQRRK